MQAAYVMTSEAGILIPVGESAPSGDGRASILRTRESKIPGNDCLHVKAVASVVTKLNTMDYSGSGISRYTGKPIYKLRANGRYTYGIGSFSYPSRIDQGVTYWGGPSGWGTLIVSQDYTLDNRSDILSLNEDGHAVVHATVTYYYPNGDVDVTYDRLYEDYVFDIITLSETSVTSGRAVAERQAIALFDELNERWYHYLPNFTPLGVLANEVANKVDFNRTNTLALALDVAHLATDFKKLDKTSRAVLSDLVQLSRRRSKQNFKALLHDASGAYLGNKYGFKLTYEDFKVASEAALGLRPAKSRSSASSGEEVAILSSVFSGKQTLSFCYTFEGLNKLYEQLASRGLEIRATDLWDLVPYSFVADWFLGIGDALECFDNTRRIAKMDLSNIWWTHKMSSTRVLTSDSYEATVNLTFFRREGLTRLPALSPGSAVPTAQDHLIEGTALFLQRVT